MSDEQLESIEFEYAEPEAVSLMDLVAMASGEKDGDDLSDDLMDDDEEEEVVDPDLSDDDEEEDDPDLEDEEEDEEDADPDEDDDEDEGDEEEEEDDADEADEPFELPDDAQITVKVNGEDVQLSGAALKRLGGQEAALTQKSQALAQARQAVENQGLFLAQVMQKNYDAAKAEAAKYANVNLYDARLKLDDDEFDALRTAKEAADSRVKAIETEAHDFMVRTQETRATIMKQQAQQALRTLQEAIPEWTDELYADIRGYAVKQGMDPQTVNETVDASAILMMHKAMKFDELNSNRGQKVKQKITKTAKKVAKKATKPSNAKASQLKIAQRKVAETGGSIEAVMALAEANMA